MQPKNQDTSTSNAQMDLPDNYGDFDSLEAVESVYSAESIEVVDCVNAQQITFEDDSAANAANETFTEACVYSLDCARMAKHDRALERRSSKSRITDRRASARLTADGETQLDRRAANRAANLDAIRNKDEFGANDD